MTDEQTITEAATRRGWVSARDGREVVFTKRGRRLCVVFSERGRVVVARVGGVTVAGVGSKVERVLVVLGA